jgi:IS30 family transposase
MHKQLSMEEREILSQMHAAQYSQEAIAARLGRANSTVSRELARNGQVGGGYSAVTAQKQAEARRRDRPLVRKLEDPELRQAVVARLTREWSPDQIGGRLKYENPDERRWHVSAQTIYTWLHNDADRDHWESFLRRGGRQRKSGEAGRIPRQVQIDGRPEIIDRRQRIGDFEGDTIVSRGKQGGIVTLVDRKSGYLLAGKLKDRTATRTRHKMEQLLQTLPPDKRHSATFDNGKEFSEHEALSRRLSISVYFARPYRSWERGTNENTNGLMRQYYPKGTDFADVSHQDLAQTVESLNDRPRKRHYYQTPSEIFFDQS